MPAGGATKGTVRRRRRQATSRGITAVRQAAPATRRVARPIVRHAQTQRAHTAQRQVRTVHRASRQIRHTAASVNKPAARIRRQRRNRTLRRGGAQVARGAESLRSLERARRTKFFHGGVNIMPLLRLFGRDPESQTRQAFQRNDTYEAITHPGRTYKGLVSARQQADLAAGTNPNLTRIPKRIGLGIKVLATSGHAREKTLKDLASLPVAIPAGVLEAAANPVRTGTAAVDDINRRYFKESDKQAEARMRKQGVAAELTDGAALATGEGAVLGRGITRAAAKAPESRFGRFATEARPRLRVSGGKSVSQKLSPNFFRASGQRLEDFARRKRVEHHNTSHPRHRNAVQPLERGDAIDKANQTFYRSLREEFQTRQRGDHLAGDAARGRGTRAEKEVKGLVKGSRGPAEVVPLGQARRLRIESARVQSRGFYAHMAERAAEHDQGLMGEIRKLNRHQAHPEHGAVSYAVEGLLPLDNPARAVEFIKARRERIIGESERRGLAPPRNELATLDYLERNANKIFNGGLARFHTQELERHHRLGHPHEMTDLEAEVRRYRPQAHDLGIDYPYQQAQDAIAARARELKKQANGVDEVRRVEREEREALDALEAKKPDIDRQFVTDAEHARQQAGLPEPLYMEHFETRAEAEGKGSYNVGKGLYNAPKLKQTRLELHATGHADRRPIAYSQSVRRQISRKHKARLFVDTAETHSFAPPSEHELEEVFGHRHVDPAELTSRDWRRIMDHRGVAPSSYAFGARRQFERAAQDAADSDTGRLVSVDEEDVGGLEHAFHKGFTPGETPESLGNERGIIVFPREVYDELKGAAGLGLRAWDKIQSFQGKVILGLNPTFVPVQFSANVFQTGAGVHGNPLAFVRALKEDMTRRQVPPEVRQETDYIYGTGVGSAHGRTIHLGTTANNAVVNGGRAIAEALRFRAAKVHNAVPLVRKVPARNPINLMFSLDDKQNGLFNRTLLYNEARKQVFRDMADSGGKLYAWQQQLIHTLDLGPTDRLQALLHDPEFLEQGAEYGQEFIGNYARYTSRERRFIKRFPLFYGFLRFSVRTLFYTMPIKHPIIGAVAYELARLHVDELKDLLGGDEAPWAFANIYTDISFDRKTGRFKFNDPAVAAGRKPARAINPARINPVSNPFVDALQSGDPKGLSGFFPPVVQVALNQVYGKNAFTGRPYEDGENRFLVALNEMGQSAFPYRFGERVTQRAPTKYYQQDTLLGFPQVKQYKTDAKKQELRRAFRDQPSMADVAKQQLIPALSRPDESVRIAKERRDLKRKKKKDGGGGNLFNPGGGRSSGGSF